MPVDESAKQLYDSIFLDNLNAATSRPDFPTAAFDHHGQLAAHDGASPPTSIMSVDPIGACRGCFR